MNSTDTDIVFQKDQTLGNLTEAEVTYIKFNKDIMDYKPLDVTKLLHSKGKTCSSVPVYVNSNTQKEITTDDIRNIP